jgi:hypothetical protein
MIRIANGQGFWCLSIDAPLQQVRGGPIDYLPLDYLAEVTMSIRRTTQHQMEIEVDFR